MLEQYPSTVDWINNVLTVNTRDPADSETLLELDRRVVQVLGVLDIAVDETASELERSIEDIGRGIPRLTYDLNFMREGALVLQSSLLNFQQKFGQGEDEETNRTLHYIHSLDRAKGNMEAARTILSEAQSWSTLESEVTSLLAEQSYEKAAERLSDATKSVVVFENTPEYDTRRTLMVSLQNQLEASLSSALVSAFNTHDVAVCRRFYTIFCNIEREVEFRNYYYGSRRSELLQMWRSTSLADCNGVDELSRVNVRSDSISSQPFATFLPSFYSSFLSTIEYERRSIPSIFPDPELTLSNLIVSVMHSLEPSMADRLASFTSYYGPSAIMELIPIHRASQEFSTAVSKSMEKIRFSGGAVPSNAENSTAKRSHSRRRSDRLSFSRPLPDHRTSATEPSNPSSNASEWEQAIFEPFIGLQSDYATLETRLLDESLRNLMINSQAEGDGTRLLRERTVDILGFAEDSLSRCMAFTHGFGAAELVRVIDRLFASFVSMTKDSMFGETTLASFFRQQSSTGIGEQLSQLDYSHSDWSGIQSCLRLLDSSRSLLDRFTAFEAKFPPMMMQVATALEAMRDTQFGPLASHASRAEIYLLTQSTLNSASLHGLLEKANTTSTAGPAHSSAPSPARPSSSHSPPGPSPRLLENSRSAILELARACQRALQDIILSPLKRRLSAYADLPAWTALRHSTSDSSAGDLKVPSFSLSPTGIMQDVTEGLLNLPRLFEIYADDDALAFSIETIPFLSSDALAVLAEQAQSGDALNTNEMSRGSHPRRSPSLSLKTPPIPPPPTLSPENIASAWLSSLGASIVAHLVRETLPQIQRLTPFGSSQLSSDLEYLSTIVAALNVESDELKRWRECLDMDEGAIKVAKGSNVESEQILSLVSRMRGW
jgi:conserved oligomeric Golgi complex subunit 7